MIKIILILLAFLNICLKAYANEKVCFPNSCINAQVAQDDAALAQGINSKLSIKENEGLLNIVPSSNIAQFDAKGMHFSTDFIWLDENKKVVVIAHDVAPCSENVCAMFAPPVGDTPYVLQVSAGYAKKFRIKEGDLVKF